jgi:hypothetical protein
MTERAGAGVQPEEALKVFFEGHDRPPVYGWRRGENVSVLEHRGQAQARVPVLRMGHCGIAAQWHGWLDPNIWQPVRHFSCGCGASFFFYSRPLLDFRALPCRRRDFGEHAYWGSLLPCRC